MAACLREILKHNAGMDHREVGKYWDQNAPAWTLLARMGCDVMRDHVNTPAFLGMLPPVSGQAGLDIGCGEGHNTRQVAARGARMTAIDISRTFIEHACELEAAQPLGVHYQLASAVELPFAARSFDFAMATMSFMDVPEHGRVLKEAQRVLKPGAFLQFSICHPCFMTPHRKWVLDASGKRVAVECGEYFRELKGECEEWIFGAAPAELKTSLPKFRIPRFTRTLSSWLNLVLDAGFALERFAEPQPSAEVLKRLPHLYDTAIVADFLIVRCRKGREDSRAQAPNSKEDCKIETAT